MKKKLFTFVFLFLSFLVIGQAQWRVLENAPTGTGRFDDIFFINNEMGWAAQGSGSTVFKTEDGGNSWVQQFAVDDSYFRNIEFLNPSTGFVGTLNGVFYKTTDGGNSWSQVNIIPNPPAICGLDAVGTSTIYGCGAWFSPAYIIKSSDSGNTWEFIDMSAYATALVEVLFVDEFFGYATGKSNSGAIVLKTTDGGATWIELFNSGIPGEYVWKLQLMQDNTIIYGSIESNTQGKLLKSFDAGVSWETKPFPDPAVQGVGFVSPTHGWMGGHNSGLYETFDGGDTWTDTGLGANLNRFLIINENFGYCSGASIYKFENVLSVSNFNPSELEDIKIRIAPIPITDKLTIKIDFEHTDNLIIELYDMNGKLLQQLIRDEIETPKTKTYSFDFNYPSGSYILNIHTNNGRRSKPIIKK